MSSCLGKLLKLYFSYWEFTAETKNATNKAEKSWEAVEVAIFEAGKSWKGRLLSVGL